MIFVLSSLSMWLHIKPFHTLVITLTLLSHLHFVCTVLCKLISVVFILCFLWFFSPSVMEVLLGTQSSIYLAVQAISEV